jgi:hypothetical protein
MLLALPSYVPPSTRSTYGLSVRIQCGGIAPYSVGAAPSVRLTGTELDTLEEHLLECPECATRAEESADYVDAMRAGIIMGNYDLTIDCSRRLARRKRSGHCTPNKRQPPSDNANPAPG